MSKKGFIGRADVLANCLEDDRRVGVVLWTKLGCELAQGHAQSIFHSLSILGNLLNGALCLDDTIAEAISASMTSVSASTERARDCMSRDGLTLSRKLKHDFLCGALSDAGHTRDDAGFLIGQRQVQTRRAERAQRGERNFGTDTAYAEKQLKHVQLILGLKPEEVQCILTHLEIGV